jgi:hypothetical protein
MFLITTDVTCRVEDIVKLVPLTGLNGEQYGHTSGTLVFLMNRMEGRVDKEFTSMPYAEVLESLSNAKFQ